MSKERRKPAWGSEADMARVVVGWLEHQGWEVYQEVQIHSYGRCADMVALRDEKLWVIETTLSFTLDLMAQADGWRPYTDWISIAVPATKGGRYRESPGRVFARSVLRERGIGIMVVTPPRARWNREAEVNEMVTPRIQEHKPGAQLRTAMRQSLVPQQKYFAEAGNAAGHRWTPFQDTCMHLRLLVQANPGIELKDAFKMLGRMHYASVSSAIGSMRKQLDEGNVRGLGGLWVDGKYKVYPEEHMPRPKTPPE